MEISIGILVQIVTELCLTFLCKYFNSTNKRNKRKIILPDISAL